MKFIKNLSLNEFATFEQKHPLSRFMQTTDQYSLVELNKPVGCIGVKDDNDNLIAAAFYFVDKAKLGDVYSIKGGPLMDYTDLKLVKFFMNSAEEYFKQQKKALAFRITPPIDLEEIDDNGKVVKKMNTAFIDEMKNLGYQWNPEEPITDNVYPGVGLGYEYRKDLTKISSKDELRKSYISQARNDVKRAEKFGVYIDKLTYDQLGEFKKETEATADRRDFRDKPLEFYQNGYNAYGNHVYYLMVRLNLNDFIKRNQQEIDELTEKVDKLKERLEKKESKKLFGRKNEFESQIQIKKRNIQQAKKEQREYGNVITLSGGMFYLHPQELAYLFSFNNKKFGNYHGQHLLHDYMLQLALKEKIPTYNFYMITGKFDGSDGVLRFKQSFGGMTYRTIGWFEKPLNGFLYRIDNMLKKILGRKNNVR